MASGDGPAIGLLAEAAFLLETGWTWQDYEAAPDALIERMFALLSARAEIARDQAERAKM